MARIPIQTLQEVLQESGLPLSGASAMKAQKPFAGQAIEGAVANRLNPQFQQLDAERKSKIETLASADRQLMQSLADPSFSGYLENPLDRERVAAGAQNILAGDVGLTGAKAGQLTKEYNDLVSQSEKLFADLYTQARAAQTGSSGELSIDEILDDALGFNEELNSLDDAELQSIINELGL